MSLYLGNNLIAPNQSNAANQSLSNLDATGQAVIDGKADIDYSNCSYVPMRNDVVHLVESYNNGTSGYDIYSNGRCVQWGQTGARDVTITFLKPFNNNDYNIVGNTLYGSFGSDYELVIQKISASRARLYIDYGGSPQGYGACWLANGYIS